MANEFRHTDSIPAGKLTEAVYEGVGTHIFNSQATGDVLYAASSTQLSRLGIGSNNDVLHLASGIPAWASTLGGLTLTSPVINGTVTTTGLTLPAFTAGGDISMGANALKTTNLLFKQYDINSFKLRNSADSQWKDLYAGRIYLATGFNAGADAVGFNARNINNNYVMFQARDTDSGLVEVMRLQGAADPYFSMGGSQEFKFYYSGVATLGGDVTMGGTLAMGANNITLDASQTVDGIDVSAHATTKSANATLGHVIVETASDIDVDGDGKLTLGAHSSNHTDGTDDIQESSTAQKGICQLDDTPVNGETNEPITSNWAYDHGIATTAVHGVGGGTITSVSTANKTIYVYLEATGDADGTSKANGYTTIQAAVDAEPNLLIHADTIIVCNGTKKTGTCDSDEANKIADTGEFPDSITWAGRRAFNVDDGTWGVVSARDDDDTLSIVDAVTGAALDLCPDGDEDYVIEPTPYREQVELNSDTANYPAHTVKGTVTIQTEFYWNGDCDTQANAGEILDATADFSDVEVGDRVWVLDLTGTNGRANDYEWGTVDDVSQVGSDIVRTTLTKTPTASWKYGIVKTESSGSDDGTHGGTARDRCFYGTGISNVYVYGFYMTFTDSYVVEFDRSTNCKAYYNAVEGCDRGMRATRDTTAMFQYNYISADDSAIFTDYGCVVDVRYSLLYVTTGNERGINTARQSFVKPQYCYIDTAAAGADGEGIYVHYGSTVEMSRCHITANFLKGVYARQNSSVLVYQSDNNGLTPEDPVGTSEGAYIE